MREVVLGAGASGLSYGLLSEAEPLILESESVPGGHARSITKAGFTWDRGPHIMFSKDKFVLELMVDSLGENVHTCKRNNVINLDGTWLKYPFENGLVGLSPELRSRALISFVEARLKARNTTVEPENLEEWFTANFGEVLTELYFRPYNEKVWNVPLRRLSMSWADRIPLPDEAQVIEGAILNPTEGYLHQLFYQYPESGGYGALMDAWADGLMPGQLRLNTKVTAVEYEANGQWRVVVETGEILTCDRIVSTLPLSQLPAIVKGVSEPIENDIAALTVNPMAVVTWGIKGIDPNQYTAIYLPDDATPINRVSFPAVFSPRNAPEGYYSVQAEITYAKGSSWDEMTDSSLESLAYSNLLDRGILSVHDPVVLRSIERYRDAYVVYTAGYEERLSRIYDWFGSRNFLLHGRFGSHQYLNVDGCLRSSIELIRKTYGNINDTQLRARFLK